jgi:hypothetical protein
MNLPKLPVLGNKKQTEYFLSLILRDEKASAVIFEEKEGRINVVGEHAENFKTSLDDSTEEELLDTLDKTVSTAERSLPPGVESHKTIFGVKDSWTEDGRIKQDILLKLKKVSDELEFKPVGFLVISEAIAHQLQKEEGAPISAVLAEIGTKEITLSLIKAGRVIETKSGPIEDSASKTVDRLLHHFRVTEILPSRIIIFDGGKETLQQEFISHTWSKALNFLHVPQVATLPANYDARAVLNGAAAQMGLSVVEDSLAQAVKADKKSPAAELVEGEETTEEDKTIEEAASEFGFSGEDVKSKDANVAEVASAIAGAETLAEAAGVAGGTKAVEDILEKATDQTEVEKPKTAVDENLTHQNIRAAKIQEIPEELKIENAETKPLSQNASAITAGFLAFVKGINLSFLKSAGSSPKKLLAIGIPVIIIFLVLLIFFMFKSATVTIDIQNKTESKTEDITFVVSGATDVENNTIAAEFPLVTVDGKDSVATTGKKQTGEEAKGTVTIFNNSDTGVTLASGTKITSSNNLDFTTDKPVTVASASGDVFSGTKPGTSSVNVTAAKFGKEGNLPSGTKFTVPGNSDMAAKNDNAFSGGTTKDVQVVSQSDLNKLTSQVSKKLQTQAAEEIKKKASGDQDVLPTFISETYTKKSFSHDVGDQANEVALTAIIDYKGISYKKSDMEDFVSKKLGEGKLKVNSDQLTVAGKDLKQKGSNVSGQLVIKAGLIPEINEKELANKIKGKSKSQALEITQEIPQLQNASISIFPPLPFLPEILPFSSGKIKVVVHKNG